MRGGAVIPSIPLVAGDMLGSLILKLYYLHAGLAMRQYTSLEFSVFVTDGKTGSTVVYEDDASTTAYLKGDAVFTTAAYAIDGSTMTLTVSSQVILL